MTPVALAHLIMGDGNLNRHGLTISSESFSVNDTVRLLNVLMVKYRLNCSIRKHSIGYNIYIKEKSMPLLRTIVLPHMHSSMLYKLRINPDPYVKYTNQVNDKSKTFLPKAGKNILETKDSYRSPFSRCNESIWILRQPIREYQTELLLPLDFVLVSNTSQLTAKQFFDLFSRFTRIISFDFNATVAALFASAHYLLRE